MEKEAKQIETLKTKIDEGKYISNYLSLRFFSYIVFLAGIFFWTKDNLNALQIFLSLVLAVVLTITLIRLLKNDKKLKNNYKELLKRLKE